MKLPDIEMTAGGVMALALLAGGWFLYQKFVKDDPNDTRTPNEKLNDAIYPKGPCADAMNAGNDWDVAMRCNFGTWWAWRQAGKPKGCYALGDGKVTCPATGN